MYTNLCPTQADVEEMVVLGALGSEAGAIHDGASGAQGTEIILQSSVELCVCERAVTVAQAVLLKQTEYISKPNPTQYITISQPE